jgi:hypothetical protein
MVEGRFDKLVIGKENEAHLSLFPAGIKLYDERGELRGELLIDCDKPTLLMYDHNGKDRLMLFIDYDGTPHIRLHDANGKKRADVSVNTEGSPALQFYDATEVALLDCTLIDGETPSLSFHSHDEELRFHLLLHKDETTMFSGRKTGNSASTTC